MPSGILFWVLYVLCLVLSMYGGWPSGQPSPRAFGYFGGSLILFVLIGLLGWRIFGPILQ